jgi:DeoR/GlpR family transcriptional regulator of sugar metabolism
MFGIERLQAIREILLDKKTVDVPSLSKMLSVSEVTIRRDLDKLEKEGFIVKTYGGAMLKEQQLNQLLMETKNASINKEDGAIAEIAASMVGNNEVIFLGGGAICTEISKYLKDKHGVVVVTNNLFVAMNLYQQTNIKVILTGGELRSFTGTLIGNDAVNTLKGVLIQKAFFTVQGIDIDVGYTVNNTEDIFLFQTIKSVSKQLILTANHTIFGKIGLTKLFSMDEIDEVITDKRIPDAYKQYYYDNNIKLYTAYKV